MPAQNSALLPRRSHRTASAVQIRSIEPYRETRLTTGRGTPSQVALLRAEDSKLHLG